MVNEELYIIVEGERRKLDLLSPSGITLNYVSNLFNDLSKINASYSYTFKLPRTANNVRMLELVDDVRADGKLTRTKSSAEFIYDGVSLFTEANLYVSDVNKEEISAVLTWDLNKGLQELKDHDMNLNELGNHLPEGEYDYIGDKESEYEKDKVLLMGAGTYKQTEYISSPFYNKIQPTFNVPSEYDPTQPYFRSLHNGGLPIYFDAPKLWYLYDFIAVTDHPLYEADGKLSPLEFVQINDEKELKKTPFYHLYGHLGDHNDDMVHIPAFAFPAPIIPVPYLVGVIGRVYGVKFDFSGDKYNSLCVPLVDTKQTDALARLNYIDLSLAWVSRNTCYLRLTGTLVNSYPSINPISNLAYPRIGTGRDDWNDSDIQSLTFDNRIMRFDTVMDEHSEVKLRVGGKVTFTVDGSNRWYTGDDASPKLVFRGETFEENDFFDIGTITASDVRRYWDNGVYKEDITFNCNPEEGFGNMETEAISKSSICVGLMYGDKERYDVCYSVTGSLRVYVVSTNYQVGCKINLFNNLPDISCMEFIKSICYALGGYPYQDAAGNIKLQEYSRLIERINEGDVNIWDSKITKSIGSYSEELNFEPNNVTSLTLAKKNYFLMKNDKLDDFGNETQNSKLEDAYEHGYTCIELDSDLLDKSQTLFTYPFYGGFLWQKDFYSVIGLTHNLFIGGQSIYTIEGHITIGGNNTYQYMIGQDMWRVASDTKDGIKAYQYPYFEKGEAKPLLGVISSVSVPLAIVTEGTENVDIENQSLSEYYYEIEYTGEHRDYLSMRPWNCETDMPKVNGQDLLQTLFGNPCLVKEEMLLNVADLAFLDIEKPVYLEKYNSYFAIKNIEVGADGISKVELIRIPSEILITPPSQPEPEIIIEPPVVVPEDENENGSDGGDDNGSGNNNGGEDFEEVPA